MVLLSPASDSDSEEVFSVHIETISFTLFPVSPELVALPPIATPDQVNNSGLFEQVGGIYYHRSGAHYLPLYVLAPSVPAQSDSYHS